jgi:DNA-binding transcriptional MocR family regulator
MTTWLPALDRFPGPRYLAIAEALASDVRSGRLPVGARLPTHRDLAWRLKVTIGTVTRAYNEAERRGLIAGEVGRGTFVRPAGSEPVAGLLPPRHAEPAGFIDLSVNTPVTGREPALFAEALASLAQDPRLGDLLLYQPNAGRAVDREAGAAWIGRSGLASSPDRVVVTGGGQHGLTAVLAALMQSGDTLAVECLSYPGLKALANLLNLRLVPIAIDKEGVLPDALETACRSGPIKAFYTMPTLHNPTTGILSEARRRAVAEIASRHGVAIVEDDVYGFLLEEAPAPIACFAPELGYYVTSTSKSLAPGLRVGYVHAPQGKVDRIAAAMRSTTYMATPLMAEIASRWIRSGAADALVVEKRQGARRRQRLLGEMLGGAGLDTHPAAFHAWIGLPDECRPEDFAAVARKRGVGVTPAAAFAVGRTPPPNAIRVSLGAPIDEDTLKRGLGVLREMIAEKAELYLAVV